MRPIDVGRARTITARLREAGDTPAADVLEQLLDERALLYRSIDFVPTNPADPEAVQVADFARSYLRILAGPDDQGPWPRELAGYHGTCPNCGRTLARPGATSCAGCLWTDAVLT